MLKNSHTKQFVIDNYKKVTIENLVLVTGMNKQEIDLIIEDCKKSDKIKSLFINRKYKKKSVKIDPAPKEGVVYLKEGKPFIRHKGNYSNITGIRKEFNL